MTDESQTQQQPSAAKEEKKKNGGPGNSGNRGGGRRTASQAKNNPSASGGGPRPSSRGSNKSTNRRGPKSSNTPTNDPASDGSRQASDTKSPEPRSKNQGGGRNGGRGGGQKKSQQTSSQETRQSNSSRAVPTVSQPMPVPASDGNDALSSLQRVITDLKSIAPPSHSTPMANNAPLPSSVSMPNNNVYVSSNLPPNAPVFQPGAASYPGLNPPEPPRHRKAASLGPHTGSPFMNSRNSFAPEFGPMIEDREDGPGNMSFEDGEIREFTFNQQVHQQTHQPRSQSQSFTAPRFAALAQQEQEAIGPTGRPQLAPGFMFGTRRRPSASGPIGFGSPIGEEESEFQFPQQQQQQPQQQQQQMSFPSDPAPIMEHKRTPSSGGEIHGIMAEQIALQNQIEMLQQQQQALYQQQLASNQMLGSSFAPQLPSRMVNVNAHRRVHSTLPTSLGLGALGGNVMGQFGAPMAGTGLDASLPRGHGRRHSVNVVNKSASLGGVNSNSYSLDGFDDGFTPPPGIGHSRQASRADSSWRLNGGVGGVNSSNILANDLAQAQAQLQSLQQFRAASGGHHQKMASFSFPNMLPNMMAANLMGLGGMNLLQQQQQQFQMQLQQQSNQPQRKSLFAPYLPQASLPPLLAAGKLVVGILRVNKRNRSDAYVATEVLDADIYICGSKDRNRALEGDIVAVELLDVDEVWGTKKEKEEKKRKKEENAAYDPRSLVGRKNDKKKDDVEVEGQGLRLFDDEEVTDEIKPQFAGHVVAVVERMPSQLFSGTLGLLRPSSAATKEKQEAERREREGDRGEDSKRFPAERPKIVWFKPTDKRVPLIAIPTEQAPIDFVENSDAYADKLFVACIKRHPISSLHPFGTLVEELGPIGDVEVETSALLKDCNFPTEEFTENVIKCIPPVPWTIPEREYEIRKDLRGERVFTIDPSTAKDLDDALSLHKNEDGTYDVGVHIADVSYFVKTNTALDRDARKKATSVYLVQRAVPMLPPTLSEQLCSLVPGQERLAFSVVFTITEDGIVTKKWFGKTVIKSGAQLSYEQAQAVLEGLSLGSAPVAPEHEAVDIEHDVKILDKLAQKLRARRSQAGFLSMNSLRLTFELDDKGLPSDCSNAESFDANKLVEEFMLLTNMSVAQQVAVHLPEQAFLRRHEVPIDRRIVAFKERVERLGYNVETSTAGTLQKSLDAIPDPFERSIVMMMASKAMHTAKYFCAGMLDIAKYSHYALNSPLYTHFTSPIRRYADIIAHRQLESILQSAAGEAKFSMDRDSVAKIAQQCNIKRESAKLAQEQSTHLFLCLLIADLTQRYGPVIRQAKVVNVLDAAFDVLVPEYGIEKRVHVDQMPIDNHVYEEHSHTLQIYWSNRDVISWLAENSDDEHLKTVKRTAEQHAVKMEVASRSVQDEHALFEEDEAEEDEIVIERTKNGVEKEKPETSKQRLLSQAKLKPQFEGLRSMPSGHKIQDIRELMTVPVIVTADLTKSPPVIKVYSVNPYAEQKK